MGNELNCPNCSHHDIEQKFAIGIFKNKPGKVKTLFQCDRCYVTFTNKR